MHYGETALLKIGNFVLFGAFYFKKKKTADICNFLSVKYFGKGLFFSENLTYKSQLFLKLRAVELAASFLLLRSSWQQTDENSRKLSNKFFWKLTPKQVFVESLEFFDQPTTKWRFFKFFTKLNGNHILMANFSKLRKYQKFVLIELHNLSKG